MHDRGETGNAFAVPDLWEKSAFADFGRYVNNACTENKGALFAPSSLDHGNEKPVRTLAFPDHATIGDYFSTSFTFPPSQDLDLHLPDLTSFEYGPLEDLENPELSSASSLNGSNGLFPCQEQEEEDVWSATQILDPGSEPADFKSWDRFYAKALKEPRTAYISEAGPSAFDAALTSLATGPGSILPTESSGRVLQSGPVLTVGVSSLQPLDSGLMHHRVFCILVWVENRGSINGWSK